jgi:hypothetical protein
LINNRKLPDDGGVVNDTAAAVDSISIPLGVRRKEHQYRIGGYVSSELTHPRTAKRDRTVSNMVRSIVHSPAGQ